MSDLIDNPVFISGHTRSGTNLLMRLLDGSESLLTPPGVGKLHVLRRLSFNIQNDKENHDARAKRILKLIELNA